MSDIEALLPEGTVDSQVARANARKTTGEAEFGSWWLHAANVQQIIAESDSQSQFGRVILQSAGWVQINLKDKPGWRLFASVAGLAAGRRLQLNTRHAFTNGSIQETSELMNYDPTVRRFVGLGATSDGTLEPNALSSRILMQPIDGQGWQMDDLVFGWVKLGDE